MNGVLRNWLHLADVSDDLAAVTHVGKGEVDPTSIAVTEEGKERIWRAVQQLYKTGTQPGIAVCIRRNGKILLNRTLGFAKGSGPGDDAEEEKVPLTPDTPICLFSASKAVTAMLIHKLAELGDINLLDPVSFYMPEFAENGKQNITIHQILSHRGGIPGLPTDVPLDTLYDSDEVWRLLCAARPIAVDGGKLAYHAITGGFVLGKLIETVTGRSIQEYMDAHLRQPLGMRYFTFGLSKEDQDAAARNYATGPAMPFPLTWFVKRALGADFPLAAEISNDPHWLNAVVPAGNIYATAEETTRFFQTLLDDGKWGRKELFNPLTVNRAVHEFGACSIDRTMLVPMRYSAGFMLGGDPIGIWGQRSGRAFGHIGLMNKFCWADPDRQIAVSVITTGLALFAHHLPSLATLIASINHHCTAAPIR